MKSKINIKLLSIVFALLLVNYKSNAQFIKSINNEPKTGNPVQVEYYDKNLLLYVTSNFTLISNDGGKNFEVLNGGLTLNTQIINDSTFINTGGNILRTTKNKGGTWDKLFILDNNGDTNKFSLSDFKIFKNGKGFVTSYPSKLKPQIYITNDFGATWQISDTLNNNFSIISSTKNNFRNKLYSFEKSAFKMRRNSDSLLLKYMEYGNTSLQIDLSKVGIIEPVSGYAFQNEDTALFITNTILSGKNQIVYLTTDGCKTFNKVNTTNPEFRVIDYAKPTKLNKGFFIGSLKSGGTAYSYDYGKTWINNFDTYNLLSLDFFDAETGIVSTGFDANFNVGIYFFTGLTNNIKEQNNLTSIGIYPNPAINNLNLNISEDFSYSITNLKGQVVQFGEAKNADKTIDVSSLPTGVYAVNLTTQTGNYYSKFIKN